MALVAGSLVVPVVVWGKKAPIHRISCVCALPNRNVVITGTHDGQICLWTVDESLNLKPKYLLLGHVTSILCLVPADVDESTTKFISSAQSGKMCLWDSVDGRCIESTMSSYVHTFAQPHLLRSGTTSSVRLFCVGHYSEILILDPQNLQPLLALASRVEPDWISAFCIVKPHQKNDIVVGVSNAGVVKIWSLTALENKSLANPLYEDESKQVQCYSARDLVLCPYNPRSMLIVCSKIWQMFDAYDFSLICSANAPEGHRWIGGAFTKLDRLVVWCSNGMAYLYQLPKQKLKGKAVSASLGNGVGQAAAALEEPLCYCILKVQHPVSQAMRMDPSFSFRSYENQKSKDPTGAVQIVLRGDSFGNLALWLLPDITDKAIVSLKQEKFDALPELNSKTLHSLQAAWKTVDFSTNGIIGHFDNGESKSISITTTLYVPSQGRLVLGREDGSIVIVAATHTLIRQFLDVSSRGLDWPLHRILLGHDGAVTCLLYPNEENPRYELNHLISGGADFCVRLWDLNTGSLIHRFCVQAGEIMRLIVPPESCNPKVLQSICSMASDHSVALLALKDLRCNLLASRHLFPIKDIRWRPLDDFLLVQCEDGTVYVWQMETGHLDRVLTGIVAEEVLFACQEQMTALSEPDDDSADQAFGIGRNLKGVVKAGTLPRKAGESVTGSEGQAAQAVRQEINLAPPMLVQGVRCNGHDAEFHLVLFNVESLIMALLVDEYGLAKSCGPDGATTSQTDSSTFSGFLAKAKETAGNVLKVSPLLPRKSDESKTDEKKKNFSFVAESNLNMEIAQLVLSILHGWEMDCDLDRVCSKKLGLLKPTTPLCFGLISREGHLSLLLPTAVNRPKTASPDESPSTCFSKHIHWQISSSLTTQHLLAIIAVANTLMSMNNAGFLPDHENKRRIVKRLSTRTSGGAGSVLPSQGPQLSSEMLETLVAEQAQVKQGWSLLAAMHCVLLPELVDKKPMGSGLYQAPRIELLARRWQERCMELREAAQALLLRELSRVGPSGRKALIDKWAPYLPTLVDPALSILGPHYMGGHPTTVSSPGESTVGNDMLTKEGQAMRMATPPEPLYIASGSSQAGSPSSQPSLQQIRRNQATAVVLLGVIGAEYGQEIPHTSAAPTPASTVGQRHPPEGFSKTDYSLARSTSQSLLELMLQPPSVLLPPYSSLRRAAIDLLGRGFVVWQPYLDISKVLVALLELCSNGDKLLPSGAIHFPLNPQADACRTGRYALALIATARPPAFITALSKEVARFNAMAQHQTVQHISSPLVRAKTEILRVIEMLSDKQYTEIVDLMIPIGEILVHCLDTSLLKQKSLAEVFPAVTKFGMISYCNQTRRIAFGGRNGALVIHELRVGKAQTVQAHSKGITACSFSDDGKLIASYSADEGKLNVWQMSQSFMGMGQSQVKIVRQLPAPASFPVSTPGGTPQAFRARLMWMNAKSVTLLLPTGTEHRFAV